MAGNLVVAQISSADALVAAALVGVGFILGSVAAGIARRLASREANPSVIQSSSSSLATLAFSIVLIASLIAALGVINSAALDQLLTDVALFLPRVISAAIVLIIANIVGNLAEPAIAQSLGHVSHVIRQRVPSLVKSLIMGFAVVIAANQLGIDTNVVLIAVGALFFGIALAAALIAGLGGRPVAEEIGAGRAIRRELKVGDVVRIGHVEGEVTALGTTSTQITSAQRITLVPNTEILGQWVEVIQDQPTIQLAPEVEDD